MRRPVRSAVDASRDFDGDLRPIHQELSGQSPTTLAVDGVDLASRAQVRQARLALVFALVKARQASDTRLFEGHGDRGSEPVLWAPGTGSFGPGTRPGEVSGAIGAQLVADQLSGLLGYFRERRTSSLASTGEPSCEIRRVTRPGCASTKP